MSSNQELRSQAMRSFIREHFTPEEIAQIRAQAARQDRETRAALELGSRTGDFSAYNEAVEKYGPPVNTAAGSRNKNKYSKAFGK
jgi:hypothetical protein